MFQVGSLAYIFFMARHIFFRTRIGGNRLQVDVFILVYSYAAQREIPLRLRLEPCVYDAYKLIDTAFNRDGHDVIHLYMSAAGSGRPGLAQTKWRR